jgi:hypothetical protein
MAMVTLQDVYRLTDWWTESTVPDLIYRDVGGCIHAKLVFLSCRIESFLPSVRFCHEDLLL